MSQGPANSLSLPLAVANGGTGATTSTSALSNLGAQAASNYLLPLGNGQVGNPNILIGGNFDTNPWQRQVTFNALPNATVFYTADRWNYVQSGTMSINCTKTADAPSVAQCGLQVTNCLALTVATAQASIGAGDYCIMRYYMEGYDFAQIAQRTFTISFWHKHTVAGTYCIGICNSGSDESYVATYTQTSGGVWEYASVTVAASPTAGTWNYTNGVGLGIRFILAAGSTYQTATTNSWVAGNFMANASQVNLCGTINNVFKFALVKVEPGSYATPYPYENPVTILQECLRYYEKSYPQGTYPGTSIASYTDSCQSYCSKTDDMSCGFKFRVEKRTAPTVNLWSVNGTANAITAYPSNSTTAATVSTSNVGSTGISNIVSSGSNLVSGTAYCWHYAANAEF